MQQKTYHELCEQEGYLVDATVIGKKQIHIPDISQIKCPICGEPMSVYGIEGFGEDYSVHDIIMHSCAHIDDAGVVHRQFFGRTMEQNTSRVMFRCPNECVENMTISITNIHVSAYDEFKNKRLHGPV